MTTDHSETGVEAVRGPWRAVMVDSSGFVLSDEDRIIELLDNNDPAEAIERELGDCIPDRIQVVRGSSMPKPQYEGSDIERMPGNYFVTDVLISHDVSYLGHVDTRDRWTQAKAVADALNSQQGQA